MFPKSILFFVAGTAPILFGAVQPWVWSIYSVLICAAFLIRMWQHPRMPHIAAGSRAGTACLAFFLVWTLLQIFPMPPQALAVFSPHRHQLVVASSALLDRQIPWSPLSYDIRHSLARWIFVLSLAFYYWLFQNTFTKSRDLKMLAWTLMGLGAMESLYGLVQSLVPAIGVLWVDASHAYVGMARGTYINRNHFAGFLEMIGMLCLGYTAAMGYRPFKKGWRKLLSSDSINRLIFFSMVLVVMLFALLLSQSRAGIASAIAGTATFFTLTRLSSKKSPIGLYIMAGVIVSLFIAYGLVIDFKPLIERFLRLGKDVDRIKIWQDGLAIVRDHPLGIGLANFPHVFPVYHVASSPRVRFTHVHNDWLELLIETGWPGFVALAGGFVYFLFRSVRNVLKLAPGVDPLRFFLAVGAVSGLTALAFHSLVDFNLQIPANCIYFVTLLGIVSICIRDYGRDVHRPGKKRKIMRNTRQSGWAGR